jgi:phenylpropionate dioxygenase-like ring-hydroxylating dioxygenase large terminal subunit
MSEADPAIRRSIPFPVTEADRIPPQRYYDAGFYQAEIDHLWPHVWQMACRLEQIPEIGDWVEYSNLDDSVIVVRTADGIRGFHNACRHRGVPIAGGNGADHGNCRKTGFVCPFHGWRWNMNGENTFVYGRHMFNERQLDKADLALRPCRLEIWGNCAFVNMDDDAPGFRESMGPLLDRLDAHGAGDLRADKWFATILPANWKIAMEAFMEGFHVFRTHPQLHKAVPGLYNSMYGQDTGGIGRTVNPNATVRENLVDQVTHLGLVHTGMAGMVQEKEIEIAAALVDADLPDDPQLAVPEWYRLVKSEITRQLRAKGEAVPDLNAVDASHPLAGVEYLFPHFFLLPFFTGMSSYRIRPLGPESCLFELWSLKTFVAGEEPVSPKEPTWHDYDSPDVPEIPRQDYANIPLQQRGLHTRGFEFMRLAQDVEGLISNYQRVIDGYLAGLPTETLSAATQRLGSNFDGKISERAL